MEVGYPLPPDAPVAVEYVPQGPEYVELSTPIDEDSWVYSKFALPMLLWVFLWLFALFALTFWQQTGNIKHLYNGLPRYMQLSRDLTTYEAGQPRVLRDVRIAHAWFGVFGIAIAFAAYFVRPKQSIRQAICYLACLLLFICAVLAWIAFGVSMANYQKQQKCAYNRRFTGQKCIPRPAYAIAAGTLDAAIGTVSLIALLLLAYNTKANHWVRGPSNWEEAQQDSVEKPKERVPGEMIQRNVGYVRRWLTGLALIFLLACIIALLVFLIILHDQREHQFVLGPRGRGDRTGKLNSNLPLEKPGWKTQNTRLRYSLVGIGLLSILLNFLTFRSKTVAYVFGFIYFSVAVMAMVAFAFDVHELRWALSLKCPDTPDGLTQKCFQGQFIATAVLDFFCFVWLILYVVVEYVLMPTPQCQHCDRAFKIQELIKHETHECGARPVRCEVCAKPMTKQQFDKHRTVCSSDHVRCKNCSSMIPKWGVKTHQEECARWPVECSMCDAAVQRQDMPHHVMICPNRPTTCEACGETFRSKDMTAHRALCGDVVVRCEQCDDCMQRYRLHEHTSHDCPRRLLNCQQCGQDIPAFRWERHRKDCC